MTDKTSDFIGSDDAVRKHYQASLAAEDLLARIKARIVALGVGPEAEREIAQLDHFHMRGSRATAELAQLAGIVPGIKILDAGSGLGGPSRYLATQHGCSVVGVDLSPAFVELAAMLAQRVETEDRLSYEVGNIAKLRFSLEIRASSSSTCLNSAPVGAKDRGLTQFRPISTTMQEQSPAARHQHGLVVGLCCLTREPLQFRPYLMDGGGRSLA